ncbi:hypothetical protein FGO68_gene4653 [Halteria grandinella]|uniref:Uncharacterized protein n=1 Tax=Halteria grandinella TaxID=5974 RepID=A0A8J8NFP2_HALGN|nr:hypothetical protein FGO68_gene4653 [Halteria grandinella]
MSCSNMGARRFRILQSVQAMSPSHSQMSMLGTKWLKRACEGEWASGFRSSKQLPKANLKIGEGECRWWEVSAGMQQARVRKGSSVQINKSIFFNNIRQSTTAALLLFLVLGVSSARRVALQHQTLSTVAFIFILLWLQLRHAQVLVFLSELIQFRLIIQIQVLSECHKQLDNVEPSLGTRLKQIVKSLLFLQSQSFGVRHLPNIIPKIYTVAHQVDHHILLIPIVLDLLQPPPDIFKCVPLAHVVHNNRSMRVLIEQLCYTAELLLAGGVPYLQFDNGA